jgi:acyl-CoA synthetase (AMP-forming)/AMP-acid ligase II/acyl carrier protein
VFVTTALFNLLVKTQPDIFARVDSVLFGGEACDPNTVRSLLASPQRPRRLLHMYGPTENTTYSSFHEVTEVLPGATTVPIGIPIDNSTLHVLDRHRRPVPLGVPGEIYVGGPGLAVGYLNRPDLTDLAFVRHPFSDDPADRLYRTGDLGRLLESGALEILGRADDQVKIRGFRIELTEIENVLSQQPGFKDVCVVAREDEPGAGKILVAYMVLKPGFVPVLPELRARLRSRMPDFMVPRAFVTVDGLPLTPNGKVDKRALPKPMADHFVRQDYIAPRNPIESTLAQAWCDVLGVSQVGIHDDFFELGGHSLLVTKVASRLKEALGLELPLRTLFEIPTIAGLADIIGTLLPSATGSADASGDEEDFEEGSL